jgi:magnesium-protoporphyrin IX monomethyl ester (oxidative) cyclase
MLKRVLLINPPRTHCAESDDFNVSFPIGLMYIAAMIRDICHVEIFDCIVSDFEIKKENNLTTYGTSFERIKTVIEEKIPHIVGISVPFTAQFNNAKVIASICKEVNPEIITVFGGPDPSVRFKYMLEKDVCDYCVIGEGEKTFHELVQKFPLQLIRELIPGLAFKRNGIIHYENRPFIKNLDELPFPALDLINVNIYLQNPLLHRHRSELKSNSISVITSRGCPFNCVFCSIHLHMGKQYRFHSPEYVVEYLRLCIDKYGITNFLFEDDNLSLNKNRFGKLLDLIIKNELNLEWDTPNGIRADTLDYNLLKKIKESGGGYLTFAFESGSQRVLDKVIKKKTNLDYMKKIVKYCKELRIKAKSFYVIGFPGERLDEMMETVKLAIKLNKKYDLDPILLIATPLYGTELYNICIQNGFIKGNPTPEELSRATQRYGLHLISTPDFSTDDIDRLVHLFEKRLRAVPIKKRLLYYVNHPVLIAAKILDKFKNAIFCFKF